MTDIQAGAVLDPGGTIFCPYDHPGYVGPPVTASQISVDDDDSETGMGNELITYRCMLDHEWSQPSRRQQVRMVAYGQRWKGRRDRFIDNPSDDTVITRQQITPVIDGF